MTFAVRSIHETSSLPEVRHTTPCSECPFRRKSPAGWLGGGSADGWLANLQFMDTAFACHVAERAKKSRLVFCAGSMIHYRNSLKTPRDPRFAAMVMMFAKDRETVFEWPREFHGHHANGHLSVTRDR